MNAAAEVQAVADLIRSHRFRYATEQMLQEGIAAALADSGLRVHREVRLNERDRIDLLTGRVGVEVKVNGAVPHVRRQLERYLESEHLGGLVLVTARVRHVGLYGEFHGKPVRVVTLAGGGL